MTRFQSLYQQQNNSTNNSQTAVVDSHATAVRPWPALSMDGFQPVSTRQAMQWPFEITGMVAERQVFSLNTLLGLPQTTQSRRIIAPGGWTYRGEWQGLPIRDLVQKARPLPEATHVVQTDALGRQEVMTLPDFLHANPLLCHREGRTELEDVYGGPLWLLFFDRYCYKGLQQIIRLTLTDEPPEKSHCEQYGWHPQGLVEAGEFLAIDMEALRRVRGGEEITDY